MGIIYSLINYKKSKSNSNQFPTTFDPRSSDVEKEFTYYLSNDINDVDRLHMSHFFKKSLFKGYFASPIEDKLIQGGRKVLDVACGPGTWLLCLSSKYENSEFIGLDIKPLFPQEIKPKNLEFIEADIFNGLPFPDNEFDFAHVESMAYIFTREQWDFVFSELIRVTKPGGHIEVAEGYVTYINSGPIFYQVYEGVYTSSLKRNVDITLANSLDSILESHLNITSVNREERTVILGPNGGKAGLVIQEIFKSFLTTESAIEGLSAELGISIEEYKSMVEKVFVEELQQTGPELLFIRIWTQKINNN